VQSVAETKKQSDTMAVMVSHVVSPDEIYVQHASTAIQNTLARFSSHY